MAAVRPGARRAAGRADARAGVACRARRSGCAAIETPNRAAVRRRASPDGQPKARRGAGEAGTSGAAADRFRRPIDPQALYDQARDAIENSQFDQALRELKQLTDRARGPARISRLGRRGAVLEGIQPVEARAERRGAPDDPGAGQAVREEHLGEGRQGARLEIQQATGQPVSAELQNDEELKLLALRGVMQTDPDKGLPIIEKMLAGGATPRVRDRALFVLARADRRGPATSLPPRRRTTRTPSCRSAPSATSA